MPDQLELDDSALVAQVRAGNRRAFGELVRRHQTSVFRTCVRVLGQREDAEDATQETFLRAFQKLDQFAQRSQFRTWLLRIAVNISLNERGRRKPATSIDQDGQAGDVPDPLLVDVTVLAAETVTQVHAALQLLPPNHRAAVVLRDLEALSYSEVAVALNIPEGTAKGWVHRGRLRLKELLT